MKPSYIFYLALALREGALYFMPGVPSFTNFDSWEYYFNSLNLTVWKEAALRFGYSHWYERIPAYVLFLHYTFGFGILVQLILSAFSVMLMYKMYPNDGQVYEITAHKDTNSTLNTLYIIKYKANKAPYEFSIMNVRVRNSDNKILETENHIYWW